jgi:hypothetical protein
MTLLTRRGRRKVKGKSRRNLMRNSVLKYIGIS